MIWFENFKNYNGDNFYSTVGYNLVNYLEDYFEKISKWSAFMDDQLIKNLIKDQMIDSSDANRIIQSLEKEIQTTKDTLSKRADQINEFFCALLAQQLFLLISSQIKVNEAIEEGDLKIPLSLFDLDNWRNFERQHRLFLKKLDTDLNKVKDKSKKKKIKLKKTLSIIEKINKEIKRFFSKDADKYRAKIPKIKEPDPQAEEMEEKIHKNVIRGNQEIDVETSPTVVKKISYLTVPFAADWIEKFDQKGLPGSGKMMKKDFLQRLQKAEEIHGKPFVITSGYRTPEYQKKLKQLGYKAAEKSTHVEGVAADISTLGDNDEKIIDSLKKVGFNRFGVAKNFIHADLGDMVDPDTWKPYARWTY